MTEQQTQDVKSRFNLSEWALNHQTLVLYLMLILMASGLLAYSKLGQSEDPLVTFKVMLVRTSWPDASAVEIEQQITDKIDKKLQEVPHLGYLNSYSRPGELMIFLLLRMIPFQKKCPNFGIKCAKKLMIFVTLYRAISKT